MFGSVCAEGAHVSNTTKHMLLVPSGVALLTLVGLYGGYHQSVGNTELLSPQGCRMSWMSPSYVLQTEFNELWTPLSRRYSLWLYRELEWDTATKVGLRSVPCIKTTPDD